MGHPARSFGRFRWILGCAATDSRAKNYAGRTRNPPRTFIATFVKRVTESRRDAFRYSAAQTDFTSV
jgi:hypothetical protein